MWLNGAKIPNLTNLIASVSADRNLPPSAIVDHGGSPGIGDVGRFDASIFWLTVRYVPVTGRGGGSAWLADYGVMVDQSVNLWAD